MYAMYYVSMLQCWQLVRILVRTNHPYLRVERHILASPFSLTKEKMDILNHVIDFMTCEMWWRTPPLSVTIELILHTPKLVFHWNVVSMSHVHCFS
jgi:hypothetical protein